MRPVTSRRVGERAPRRNSPSIIHSTPRAFYGYDGFRITLGPTRVTRSCIADAVTRIDAVVSLPYLATWVLIIINQTARAATPESQTCYTAVCWRWFFSFFSPFFPFFFSFSFYDTRTVITSARFRKTRLSFFHAYTPRSGAVENESPVARVRLAARITCTPPVSGLKVETFAMPLLRSVINGARE